METKKIQIRVISMEGALEEFVRVFAETEKGIVKKRIPTISFESFKAFQDVFTPKRLELLCTIRSKKPDSIKNLSEISHRDFKNVYHDVKTLEKIGLVRLEKNGAGLMPKVLYDEIELDIKIPLIAS